MDTAFSQTSEGYKDILGCWQEYIIHADRKEKTSIRRIALNSEGKLNQSIVYEMGTQCRIWLDNDKISYSDGHLEFWGGEFKGDISEDKNSILLVYKQMANPFLLERILDENTIFFMDRLEASQGGTYIYSIPEDTGDGWICTDLEDVNINREKIISLIKQIRQGKHKDLHSLLIIKNNKLVLEEYFAAEGKIAGPFVNQVFRDRIQMQASVSKSVNSALIGIAMENGFIEDLQTPAFELFPEYVELLDQEKKSILLEHLLTMSAGLQWNELQIPYSNPLNDTNILNQKNDLMKYILEKPRVNKPGRKFVYHTGLSLILGEILNRSAGMPADKFAEKYLFGPLGISDYRWVKRQNGWIATGGGLALRARDMAKFGQLYLNDGIWENRQVIPSEWIRASVQPQIKRSTGAYGYQWWLRSFHVNGQKVDSYYAIGNAGQFIMIFPESTLIVVSTAQNYDSLWSQRYFNMISTSILPAVLN